MEDFNIIYDHESNKIKIYQDGEWTEYIVQIGLPLIMNVIKDYFIDSYEKYLIYNIEKTTSYHKKQCYREHLHDCYMFLCCFDIKPSSHNMSDAELLDSNFGRDSYEIAERCIKEYKAVEAKVTKSEINRINKNNTRKTIKDINKRVMELIKVDESFQQIVAL